MQRLSVDHESWKRLLSQVTRLSTLQRAASLCGHDPLLELVEAETWAKTIKNHCAIGLIVTKASSSELS